MNNQRNLSVFRRLLVGILAPAFLISSSFPQDHAAVYTKQRVVSGVPILATDAVDEEYLSIAALVYEHMTSRAEPYDLRALHRESGFRILLINPEQRFLDLPEYAGEDAELEEAGGLGGSIGEFHIAVRVGSPHTLVHELGHGIYHSAIQFAETGGARDEEAWYRERVRAVHDMDLEEAMERLGEEQIHEVLLAPANTFSADLANAWRNAKKKGLWKGDYAGTEPNEYWAEGVALWFRAARVSNGDPRDTLRERDPMLHALCARIFPNTDWTPFLAHAASGGSVAFVDDVEHAVAPSTELAHLFQFLDRNGDGRVAPYEGAEAMLFLTREADSNADDATDYRELRSYLEEEREGERVERELLFDELDTNQDGFLTRPEIPDEFREFFGHSDVDGDHQISISELLAAEHLGDPSQNFEQELLDFLEEVDHDKNGAFALADMPAPERAEFEEEFRRIDVNADNLVTKQELLALLDEELSEAVFAVEGHTAFMSGVIGASTPGRVLELILEYPEVSTIAMLDVPGSMDDVSNLRAARFVRRMRLATHIPHDGTVASGGTDFFLAGASRTADQGARFGVHSWSGAGEEGAGVARDDPAHEKYLDYYRALGIPEDFYWYTLEAAPADGIHWMTPEELKRYGVLSADADNGGSRTHTMSGLDESYGLDSLEIRSGGRGVVPLSDVVAPSLRKVFDRYARVLAPSGRPIHILAQHSWSEDQIVHVRKVLEHLLTDAPGASYGADKSSVAEAMAERHATMVLFDDIEAMEAALDGPLQRVDLAMQDLRANECTPPGSPDYLRHETRDATYEEVLHLVHDYGLRPALSEYDALLEKANVRAAAAGLWEPWPEDEPDSHRNEYIAAIYDNYLDLWTVAPTRYEGEAIEPADVPAGTSHFGAYRAGSRARLEELDPKGLDLAEMFFQPALTFTAEIPTNFEGTFHINRLPELRYSTKSQHLRDVTLRGNSNACLVGNDHANTLTGNNGDNELQGAGGDDRLIGGGGNDVAVFRGARTEYDIRTEDGQTYVSDTVPERDGSDQLQDVERLRFSDTTEAVANALPVDHVDAAIQAMTPFADRLELNEKGFPEATLADGTVLIYLPEGRFQMGTMQLTEAERPVHEVFLSGCWIGKYPVTNAQFAAFVEATEFVTDAEKPGAEGPYVYDFEERYFKPTPGRNWRDAFSTLIDDHPVSCVSWYDAMAYASWLSNEVGLPIGLPTEAQWEKAARGSDGRIYPWGNEPPNGTRANYCDRRFAEAYPGSHQGTPDLAADDGYAATSPVDAYPAGQSPYGVFDLAGNLTEWVFDRFGPYSAESLVDPVGPTSGRDRCMRCGIWVGDAGLTPESIREKHNLRAENRSADDPRSSDDHLGFRIAAAFGGMPAVDRK